MAPRRASRSSHLGLALLLSSCLVPLNLFALPQLSRPLARPTSFEAASLRRPARSQRALAKASSLTVQSVWGASGIGPLFLAVWAKLAVFPPFSWIQWLLIKVWSGPKFYRYYFIYSTTNSLAQWLVPGLHAQLMTGTWLGILKATNPGAYTENVANRLRMLLVKQAQMKSGNRAATLPKESLDVLCNRLKEDAVLTNALGSTSTLRVWHKFERTPLDSPKLKEMAQPQSQERWVLEALLAGYYDDVLAVARDGNLISAAAKASTKMKALQEAVGQASFLAKNDVVTQLSLTEVDKASNEAAAAFEALNEAKAAAKTVGADASAAQSAWTAKLAELKALHASHPAVASELERLSD